VSESEELSFWKTLSSAAVNGAARGVTGYFELQQNGKEGKR
jgi:hypothetical protein